MAKKSAFSSLSQAEIADMYGVDVRTVRRWDEDGHPRNSDGSYTARKSIEWRLARVNVNALDLDAERARLAKEQADRAASENAVRAGKYYALDKLEADAESAVIMFRESVMAVPDRLAPVLAPETPEEKAREMLAAEMRHCLESIYRAFDPAKLTGT